MLKFLKSFFAGKPAEPAAEAPYKVEASVQAGPAKCGCGRSQSGNCVGLHKLTPEEWATHEDNPAKPQAKKKRTFVKRAEGETKAKVAAIKAPAKAKAPKKPKAK